MLSQANVKRIIGLVFLSAMLHGCAFERMGVQLDAPPSNSPEPSVVIFFVDGLDHARFNAMLEAKQLPNIERYFVEGGAGVKNAVTSIPSITYPNAVSLITGCFPGHHGILGNQWFDRKAYFLRDYASVHTYQTVNTDFANPTLFELLDDKYTVNVRCHTHRGVSESVKHTIGTGLDWAMGRFLQTDKRIGLSAPRVVKMAQRAGRWPTVYYNYFPGVDATGHEHGSDSDIYGQALKVADTAIGQIIETVEAQHLQPPPYYVLVTDHAHVPSHPDQFSNIDRWLRKAEGLRIHRGAYGGAVESWRSAYFDRFDAVLINGAYRRISLHLKGENGWTERISREAIERLIRPEDSGFCGGLPGILLACHRPQPGQVIVYTDQGSVQVERRIQAGRKEYRVVATSPRQANIAASQSDRINPNPSTDPDFKLLSEWSDGKWRTSRDWLALSGATLLPDFVPQIVEFFDSDRAGDLVLFANDEWSFLADVKGGHGSCLSADMRIPMFFSGPGITPGTEIPTARLVDVMPTVLDMLGEHDRLNDSAPIDGVSLLPQLRDAINRP